MTPQCDMQERAELNAEIVRLREAGAVAAAAKKSAAAALMREVDASNAAQLARRAAAKAAAIEDDKVIARFIQERDAREQVMTQTCSSCTSRAAAMLVDSQLAVSHHHTCAVAALAVDPSLDESSHLPSWYSDNCACQSCDPAVHPTAACTCKQSQGGRLDSGCG